ncbi:histone-lysine N-methyltransferase setd3 like protein, partial [Danaus plexippus plexippus]
MGRKLQSKLTCKKKNVKEGNRFLQQRRKELAVLVDTLLKLTSTFQSTGKSFEHHLQIEKIIKEIINIESISNKSTNRQRKLYIENYVSWLHEHGAEFEGVEISEFDGYGFGLKATKDFSEGSLILTVPGKVMMSEKDPKASDLSEFINIDPLLQNMPNVTLALFLLLEKNNPNSFWKPYIDVLPEKYSTVLYFNSEELAELRPSPVFESSLKLYRSIVRQYAYFYNKIHTIDLPVLKNLQDIFTFDNYRWAVSTVMTRQNNIVQGTAFTLTNAFIPLWDMCNHKHGKITTDFNLELNRGECYALQDYRRDEQIFIFYGARPNSDLFLHNGFVYPDNDYDSLSIALGISPNDALRNGKVNLLNKLGLSGVTNFSLYKGASPISVELLAFIRIFNMNQEELEKWSAESIPSDLLSFETGTEYNMASIDKRGFTYLLTRCGLIRGTYKDSGGDVQSEHRKNIKLLKQCEVQILENAIKYLRD